MRIEIFEAPGYQLDTDIDALLLNLARKYEGEIMIRKASIMDKDSVKKHKDVVKKLKKDGMDALPVVKIDGKVVGHKELQKVLYRL